MGDDPRDQACSGARTRGDGSGSADIGDNCAMTITIKSPEDIEKMRIAGRLAAEVLQVVAPHVKPGVTVNAATLETAVKDAGFTDDQWDGVLARALDEKKLFRHTLPRPKTRPEIRYGREPQTEGELPPKGDMWALFKLLPHISRWPRVEICGRLSLREPHPHISRGAFKP